MSDVLERLSELGVVPVVEIDDANDALALADALEAAGLPAAEITLRTEAAAEAIRVIAENRPSFLVGAGTVIRTADVDRAARAGARFLVSPGLTPALAGAVRERDLPFIPGAVTAGEAIAAIEAGWTLLKFFPAEASGGVAAIRALAAPLATQGVRFMPTGGIRPQTLADYLAVPAVAAVGGSWIATAAQIREGDFSGITQRASAALETARTRGDRTA